MCGVWTIKIPQFGIIATKPKLHNVLKTDNQNMFNWFVETKSQITEYMNQNDFYWAFTLAKVVIYQHIHSIYLIWRAFERSRLLDKFEVWGFLWSSLRHFWLVFLLDFLKWNSILCQIYWIPDLQSLDLVCFMVANTGSESMQILLLLTRSLQDGNFWSVLNRGWRRVKTLQILVDSF